MTTKIVSLAAVLVMLAATGAAAATRLVGPGCCPLCK